MRQKTSLSARSFQRTGLVKVWSGVEVKRRLGWNKRMESFIVMARKVTES